MLQKTYGKYVLKERKLCVQVGVVFSVRLWSLQGRCKIRTPSTSCQGGSIDRVCSLVLSDRRMTVRMIAEALGWGKSPVHQIFNKNWEIIKACAKILPELLTPQKLWQKERCIGWKTSDGSDEFLKRVVTATKLEFMNTTSNLSRWTKSGKRKISHGHIKLGRTKQEWKSCWPRFFFYCHEIVDHKFVSEG